MKEVQQEFLVTKTIQEVESSRELDINFVGVYYTADDKVSLIFFSISTFYCVFFLPAVCLAPFELLSECNGFSSEKRPNDLHNHLRC